MFYWQDARGRSPSTKTMRVRPGELRIISVSLPEAGDYVESRIDLNELPVGNRLTTYVVRVVGDSMPDAEARQGGRVRRRGRGRRQPQSKHTFKVCLQFVTYQKEVLGHDHI